MHGDIPQHSRELTLQAFKEGRIKVLVATDVASRGLDIPNVELIVQVEPPQDPETYIHRAGRTARAGKEGTCVVIFQNKTRHLIQQVEDRAGIKFEHMDIPNARDVERGRQSLLQKVSENDKVVKKLQEFVNDNEPDLVFKECQQEANEFLQAMQGNASKALAAALSYIKYSANKPSIESVVTGDYKRREYGGGFNRDKENFSSNMAFRGGRGGYRGGASGRNNSSERMNGGRGRGRPGVGSADNDEFQVKSFGYRGRGEPRDGQRPRFPREQEDSFPAQSPSQNYGGAQRRVFEVQQQQQVDSYNPEGLIF